MIKFLRGLASFVLRSYMWLALLGLFALGYFGYVRFTPQTRTIPSAGAERVVRSAVQKIVASIPEPETPRTVLVLPFKGDRADDYVREQVAQGLLDSGMYQVIEKTFTERAMDAVNLQRSRTSVPSEEAALSAAKRAGADAVLFGEVQRFKQTAPAELSVDWSLLSAKPDEPTSLSRGDTTIIDPPFGAAGESAGPVGAGWALLIWVGTTLLLPLFIGGVLVNFLARESNLVNLLLLGGLTLVNIALALFLLGWTVAGLLDSLLVLAAGITGGAYNYLLLDKLESTRA